MARFKMELPILGVQMTNVEGKIYAKVFVGEEPDGQTEQISSIMTMPIREEYAAEVFAASAAFKLGQMVRLDIETERGGKQTTKNVVLHIEAVEPQRSQVLQQPGKPAEQLKP